jgi:hypothetical protein
MECEQCSWNKRGNGFCPDPLNLDGSHPMTPWLFPQWKQFQDSRLQNTKRVKVYVVTVVFIVVKYTRHIYHINYLLSMQSNGIQCIHNL